MSAKQTQSEKPQASETKSGRPKKKAAPIRGKVDKPEKTPLFKKYVFIPQFAKFMQHEDKNGVKVSARLTQDQADKLNEHAHVTGVAYALDGDKVHKELLKAKSLRDLIK